MNTKIDEIATGIYRLSTYIKEADLAFNQYLIDAEQPFLFHCGMRGIFPLVSAAVVKVMPLSRLRWISYGHWEADEAGAMNDWLAAAPLAQVAVGTLGCMLSANDIACRPPRALADDEVLDLGGKRIRYLATPHVPHCWDAGLIFEETTSTLFSGDLFTRNGEHAALSTEDPIAPAMAAEDLYGATALTPQTAPTLRRLASYSPKVLGLMHGPAFAGDCRQALQDLANCYEERLRRG